MIYGYARCSTNETKQDIKRQIRELEKLNVPEKNIYFEYESGTKVDRLQLKRLLEAVQAGDTIVATEVSRISRSIHHLCEIIEFAKNKNLKLILGKHIIDCTQGNIDPMAIAMIEIMGVFAQLERNIMSERIKSGLENARLKGSIIGRPHRSMETIPTGFIKHYPKYKSKQITLSEFARMINCSRQSIYRYLKVYENQ